MRETTYDYITYRGDTISLKHCESADLRFPFIREGFSFSIGVHISKHYYKCKPARALLVEKEILMLDDFCDVSGKSTRMT